ncbi:MAG: helix-hairpin-helix domain-containing protein [Acidobacteriota bacterium]
MAHGQAIEDVEPIGLGCAAAVKLSKAGLVLLDHLREASPADLRAAGLSAAEVVLIQQWRGDDGTENPSPIQILDDLIDLPDVGPAALRKLKAAGIDTLESLQAAEAEMLEAMRLGKALAPIEAWRDEQ